MPEEDLVIPGIGRRLLIFTVANLAELLHQYCSGSAKVSQGYCIADYSGDTFFTKLDNFDHLSFLLEPILVV